MKTYSPVHKAEVRLQGEEPFAHVLAHFDGPKELKALAASLLELADSKEKHAHVHLQDHRMRSRACDGETEIVFVKGKGIENEQDAAR